MIHDEVTTYPAASEIPWTPLQLKALVEQVTDLLDAATPAALADHDLQAELARMSNVVHRLRGSREVWPSMPFTWAPDGSLRRR